MIFDTYFTSLVTSFCFKLQNNFVCVFNICCHVMMSVGSADSGTSSTVAFSTIWSIKSNKGRTEKKSKIKCGNKKKLCCHRELDGKRSIALSFPPWNDLL